MIAPELIGLIGILILLGLLAGGVPIGNSLALVGIGGLAVLISPEAALIKAGVVSFEVISKYELGVLPLFLLMAHLCFAAGASRDFFDVAAKFVGHRRGGLALASIGGCAGFGAISGSSLATVATISSVALPEMRKAGYHPGFAWPLPYGAALEDHRIVFEKDEPAPIRKVGHEPQLWDRAFKMHLNLERNGTMKLKNWDVKVDLCE